MQIRAAWFLLSAAVLSGCGGKHVHTESLPEIGEYALEPVLLVPFQPPAGAGETLRNKGVREGGPEFLRSRLIEKLKGMGVALREIGRRAEPAGPSSSEAIRLGAEYGVPSVLFGTVSTYVDREGSPAGVDRPASVDFSVILMETGKGRVLWKARFHETQKTLFEDLFEIRSFWKRRGRWLTADELAEYGLNELLRDSPWPEKSGAHDEDLPGH